MFVYGNSLTQESFINRLQFLHCDVFGEYSHICFCYICLHLMFILFQHCCSYLFNNKIGSKEIFFALSSSSSNVCVSSHAFAVLCGVRYLFSVLWIWKQVYTHNCTSMTISFMLNLSRHWYFISSHSKPMEQLGRYYKVSDWCITCGERRNSSYLKACWHYLLGCSCNGAVITIHFWSSHTVFCCYQWWRWYIRNALMYSTPGFPFQLCFEGCNICPSAPMRSQSVLLTWSAGFCGNSGLINW